MTKGKEDNMEDVIEELKDILDKAKDSMVITKKIMEMLHPLTFSMKMSIINSLLVNTVLEEADSPVEAAAYFARVVSTSMKILDSQVDGDEDDDDDESFGNLQ